MRTVYIVDDSQAVRERLIGMVSELEGTALSGATGEPREALDAIGRLLEQIDGIRKNQRDP